MTTKNIIVFAIFYGMVFSVASVRIGDVDYHILYKPPKGNFVGVAIKGLKPEPKFPQPEPEGWRVYNNGNWNDPLENHPDIKSAKQKLLDEYNQEIGRIRQRVVDDHQLSQTNIGKRIVATIDDVHNQK